MKEMIKKTIVLLCKELYFSLPCIKYSRACGWSYYHEILGIYIDLTGKEPKKPGWVRPWVWNLSAWLSDKLMWYMKKHKQILKDDYYKKSNN